MRQRTFLILFITLVLIPLGVCAVQAWSPVPVEDDPLVRMPGTQPGQVTLENPNRCLNCHGGYDQAVEPGFNWQGSMMAQAARDFLFWACLTVAGQDSIWALDRPNAVDICERCHFPKGWLEGRSDPPNASAMTGADYDGVQCDFCHSLYEPFFESTYGGTREGDDWLNYWDETNASGTPSQPAASTTYAQDSTLAQGITLFNGGDFYSGNLPFSSGYVESGAGQYFASPDGQKRAPFSDATGRHAMLYSRYHKSKYFCSTCHDVSNPVLANLIYNGTPPGDGTTVLTTETDPAYSYFHVERTFSEFMLSDYGQQGGAPGIGPFAPGQFETSLPNDYIARCQDCHMPDAVGVGADMTNAILRPGGSTEHPNSGQPVHDMTGGNAWVSWVLASAVPGSPNYDPINAQLLNQGSGVLTLDLAQGQGIDPVALLAGVDRAKQQLQIAAEIQNLSYDPTEGSVSFRVQNQTGHKLISGFPEGRRMFINVRAYAGETMIFEVNPYDTTVGTLKGLDHEYSPSSPPLGPNEAYVDGLVYEVHPSSTHTGEEETFHFALATGRYKDNRIPPKGFRIGQAATRLSEPVWDGEPVPDYFTVDEYAGGYDSVDLGDYEISIPEVADRVEVRLYYQTTSREYIEFLRDEINGTASTLPPSAYIIQTDPFFAQLKAWGDTIWQLWDHNKDQAGAAPFLMTQASVVGPQQPVVHLTSASQSVDEGVGMVRLTVELNTPAEVAVTVPYTVGGTATGAGVDHDLADGSFLIPVDSLTDEISFTVTDDTSVEEDETVIVTLGEPQNALLGEPSQQTITIQDNDVEPVLCLTAAEQVIPESIGTVTVTVELTTPAGAVVTVPYTVSGTATGGGTDHDLVDGVFEIPLGLLTGTVTFNVTGDWLIEEDETVIVTLGQPENAVLGEPDQQTITIQDDDVVPVVRLSQPSQVFLEGIGVVTVTAELTAPSGVAVSVSYTVSGTATGGGVDHDLADGSFLISAGSLTDTVAFLVVDDDRYEPGETVVVTLDEPNNAILGTPDQQTITILNNDARPEIAFSSLTYTVEEGVQSATITVTLTGATALTATVDYATQDGTATGGDDYVAVSGTLTFTPGITSQAFSISILDDTVHEARETVSLILSNPSQAVIGDDNRATLAILDNDARRIYLPIVVRAQP